MSLSDVLMTVGLGAFIIVAAIIGRRYPSDRSDSTDGRSNAEIDSSHPGHPSSTESGSAGDGGSHSGASDSLDFRLRLNRMGALDTKVGAERSARFQSARP